MKKIFLILLTSCLLPIFSAAQEPPTPVPYSCGAGSEFTIRVPAKFAAGRSVEYVWYRNDTAVTAAATLAAGAKAISYTIPASKAFGDLVSFYFKYRLNDGCDEWTFSPLYWIAFLALEVPQASVIAGDAIVCSGVSGYVYTVVYAVDVFYSWTVSAGWTITAGQGTNRITVTAGTADGTVSVTPVNYNGVGDTRTHAVAITVPVVPGVADVNDYICVGGVSSPGVADVADYSCDSALSAPGVADVNDYTCVDDITDPGVADVEPYQANG